MTDIDTTTIRFAVADKNFEKFNTLCELAEVSPDEVLESFVNQIIRPPSWVRPNE